MQRLSGEDLRKKILEEATGIVYREGVERITMRALGEKLGYSPATIYLYFKNKDELLLEIAQDGFEQLADRQLPGFEANDPREALRRTARAYLDFALENPTLYDLMFQRLQPAREQRDRHPHALALFEAWNDLHDRGVQEGLFRIEERDIATSFHLSLLHGFAQLAIARRVPHPGSSQSLSRVRDGVLDELMRTMTLP